MDRMLAAAYDEATVILLRATSSTGALERVDDEDRYGVPAYSQPGRLSWEDRVCAWSGCVAVFVPPRHAPHQKFCSHRCTNLAAQWAFKDRRGMHNARRSRGAATRAVVAARALEGVA